MTAKSETADYRASLGSFAKMLSIACREVGEHMGKLRVIPAFSHSVPLLAGTPVCPEDEVLVWREKVGNNGVRERVGPHRGILFHSKRQLLYVEEQKIGDFCPLSVVQVNK